MKDLIRKVLREEINRRFIAGTPEIRNFIIKRMENLLSETTRVLPPPEENYGMFNEEWCKNGKVVIEARYHLDDDTDEFFAGDLYVNNDVIEGLFKLLQVRKSFILNVITEWYDEKYATKFGIEVNHPEFEIDESHETDSPRKCYQMIDTSNLSKDEMIDYIDTNTLKRRSDLEQLSDDELSKTYSSVYNVVINRGN
jgi:hypothetical protein